MDQKNELLEGTNSGDEWKYVVLLYDEGDNILDIRGVSEENVPTFIQSHFNN